MNGSETMKVQFVAALLIGACVATGAQAQDNRYGYDQIAAKDMRAAEQRLVAQSAAEPDEPSVLLNLAYVYAKTNRQALASALYEDVLALPNAEMELGNGKAAWSHDLAQRALGRHGAMASR